MDLPLPIGGNYFCKLLFLYIDTLTIGNLSPFIQEDVNANV